MTDDRAAFTEARDAFKAKHHEQRLENATYTAVEVKALTKTAADLAYALARKEALDREGMIDVLEAEWLKHSAAKTVDSPRGHCARLADALIAARETAFTEARDAGLAIRQQRRIETREELRRRTRREVAEEIAEWADDLAAGVINRDKPYNRGFIHASETLARHAREIATKEATPDPPKCKRCRGLGIIPDFTNWDDYHGEPKPKPCPECSKEAT